MGWRFCYLINCVSGFHLSKAQKTEYLYLIVVRFFLLSLGSCTLKQAQLPKPRNSCTCCLYVEEPIFLSLCFLPYFARLACSSFASIRLNFYIEWNFIVMLVFDVSISGYHFPSVQATFWLCGDSVALHFTCTYVWTWRVASPKRTPKDATGYDVIVLNASKSSFLKLYFLFCCV